MKVYSAAIYLKSGAVIRGRFKKLEISHNSLGAIDGLDWLTEGFPALNVIDMREIAAIATEAVEDVDG